MALADPVAFARRPLLAGFVQQDDLLYAELTTFEASVSFELNAATPVLSPNSVVWSYRAERAFKIAM